MEPDRQTHWKPDATVAIWQCSLLIFLYLQAWDLLMLWWLGENTDMTKCHIISLWLWKLMPHEGQQQSAFTLLRLPQPSPYQARQTRQRRVQLSRWESPWGNRSASAGGSPCGLHCWLPSFRWGPLWVQGSALKHGVLTAEGRRWNLPQLHACQEKCWSFCGCHGSRDGERREQEWITA